jgi:hypothetical protein
MDEVKALGGDLASFRNNSACILGVILVSIGYLSSRSAMGCRRGVICVGEGLFA